MTYAASLIIPKSIAGTPTTPAAPLELEELEPEPEPEPDPERPVAEGALVIAPVPDAPAWLRTELQPFPILGDTFCAAPEKSQGLVFLVLVAVWFK